MPDFIPDHAAEQFFQGEGGGATAKPPANFIPDHQAEQFFTQAASAKPQASNQPPDSIWQGVKDVVGGQLSGAWQNAKADLPYTLMGPPGMAHRMMTHYVPEMLQGMNRATNQGMHDVVAGHPMDAAFHTAGAIPVVGQGISQVYDTSSQGQPWRAAGQGLVHGVESAAPKIIEAAPDAMQAIGDSSIGRYTKAGGAAAKAGTLAAVNEIPIVKAIPKGVGAAYRAGKASLDASKPVAPMEPPPGLSTTSLEPSQVSYGPIPEQGTDVPQMGMAKPPGMSGTSFQPQEPVSYGNVGSVEAAPAKLPTPAGLTPPPEDPNILSDTQMLYDRYYSTSRNAYVKKFGEPPPHVDEFLQKEAMQSAQDTARSQAIEEAQRAQAQSEGLGSGFEEFQPGKRNPNLSSQGRWDGRDYTDGQKTTLKKSPVAEKPGKPAKIGRRKNDGKPFSPS